MKTWIGSDFHWGHKNILNFYPITRAPYRDVVHMNESLILEWNGKVEPGDLVYMVGDIAFMSGSDAAKVMSRLNGEKILIRGNHDVKTLMDVNFRNSFKEIHDYLEITHDGHKIVLSHFPFLEWNAMHRGSLHFFGHLHGGHHGQEKYRCMDVGMDSTGEVLISLDDAIRRIKDNEIKRHH